MTEQRACRGGDTTTVVRPFTHSLEFERCRVCGKAVAWDKIHDERFCFRAICKQATKEDE